MIGRFVLGHLGAPFGLRGHIKFRPWSGDTGRILALKQVTLRRSGEERPYTLEEAAGAGAELRLKFRGIDSPEAARALSGAEVLISREEAGEPQPGEYYVEDLRNLEVVALPQGGEAGLDDPALEVLGVVTDVIEGGGGQLLELRLSSGAAGEAGRLSLVPFRAEFFGEVSPRRGRALLLTRWILE